MNQDMPLLALDQFAGVESCGSTDAPFSALMTLWLSVRTVDT
jgi:hypothetical protein